jgi:hypothetical protein
MYENQYVNPRIIHLVATSSLHDNLNEEHEEHHVVCIQNSIEILKSIIEISRE